jgi:hypothetical protein
LFFGLTVAAVMAQAIVVDADGPTDPGATGQPSDVYLREVPTFDNSPLAHSRKQSAIGGSVRQNFAMLEHR